MKALVYPVYSLLAAVLLYACASPAPEKETETSGAAETRMYRLDTTAGIQVKWTAFKFTEKVGVNGSMRRIHVSGIAEEDTALYVIRHAQFHLPIDSLTTGNPSRDWKIRRYFFGTQEGPREITGEVSELTYSGAYGPAKIKVRLNNIEKEVPVTYFAMNDSLALIGTLDLTQWNTQASLDSLNQVCYDLHKGKDGLSKLWPEVKIEIGARLVSRE